MDSLWNRISLINVDVTKDGPGDDIPDLMRAGNALNERQLMQQEGYGRAIEPVAEIVLKFWTERRIEIDAASTGERFLRIAGDERALARRGLLDDALLDQARERYVPC